MAELTVLYDGSCSLCRASIERVRPFDVRRRIEFLDLHDPLAPQRFPQIDRELALRWMQAVDSNGRVWSGADAWAHIGLLLRGWNLLAWLVLVPGFHWVAARIYTWIARNRYRWNRSVCSDGSCSLHLPDSSSKP
jgi:predicted DCC family thiol-disulfide oxidoreductase YuxK